MPFELFLAQTPAQFDHPLPQNAKKAWMSAHFATYNAGLSNLPSSLPKGSMLIVDDSIPVVHHDPQRIAQQLKEAVNYLQCSRVLLDFQRLQAERTADIAKAIVQTLPCPVGVSVDYARGLDCPVFLPPLPLHMPLGEYIAPWQDRPIWLEAMPSCARYTITQHGCAKELCQVQGSFPHFDEQACCRYRIEVTEETVQFTLRRGYEELALLMQSEQVDCFVGLYQDFAQPEAQDTALDQ